MSQVSDLSRKAAGGLTFVEGNRDVLIPQILGYFKIDAEEKKVDLPPFNKVSFAYDAKTEDGAVAGSICGYTACGDLHVDMFCANPDVTVPGMGKVLMRHMEDLARERGCTRLDLDTYSWQARPFYEKVGFTVYATQKNFPKGHERYFMEKVWQPGAGYDATPYALTGKSEGAKSLTVVEADVNEVETRLDRWLDNNTQSRKIPGVGPYNKKEFAFEVRRAADGALRAACCYETLWDNLHVSFLACEPSAKNQGIGSAVLEHLVEVAKQKGCTSLSLETLSWQARPFYERHGFKLFGTQADMPAKGMDRYFMELWL